MIRCTDYSIRLQNVSIILIFFILDIWSRDCSKTSAIVMFRHLNMFQYYHKWKKFDKSFKSLWMPPDEKKLNKEALEYRFLEEWDEKSGKGLIQNWRFDDEKESCTSCQDVKCGKKTKNGILCKYGFVNLFVKEEFGEHVEIKFEVNILLRIELPKYSYTNN